MPRVPVIEFPKRQYPTVPAKLFTEKAVGLEYIGKAIQDVGEIVQKVLDSNREKQNQVGIIKAKNYIRSREIEFANQIRNDPNYYTYQDTLSKFHQETIKGVHELVGGRRRNVSPELGVAISGEAIQSYNQLSLMVAEKEDQMFGSESTAEFTKSTDIALSYAIASDDPDNIKAIRQGLEEEGQSLVNVNYLSPAKLQEHMKKFDSTIEESKVLAALASPDPVAVERLIRQFDSFTHLGPKANIYLEKLKAHLEQTKKARQAELDSESVNTAYQDLKRGFGENYELMFLRLRDPEWLKGHGLTAERKSRVENILAAESARSYSETQNKFLNKMYAGTLTEKEVLSSSLPATGLGQGDKEWFLSKLEQKQKGKKGDIAFEHSNPKVFSEVLKAVALNPRDWNKVKIWSYIGLADANGDPAGLSGRDALAIQKVWESGMPDEPEKKAAFDPLKKALSRLDDYRKAYFFIPSPGKTIKPEQALENDTKHYQIVQQLLDRVAKGEDPFVALDTLIRPLVVEKEKSWIDSIFRFFVPERPEPIPPIPDVPGLIPSHGTWEKYKSIEDVKRAYKNNELSREEAAKILRTKFGVK